MVLAIALLLVSFLLLCAICKLCGCFAFSRRRGRHGHEQEVQTIHVDCREAEAQAELPAVEAGTSTADIAVEVVADQQAIIVAAELVEDHDDARTMTLAARPSKFKHALLAAVQTMKAASTKAPSERSAVARVGGASHTTAQAVERTALPVGAASKTEQADDDEDRQVRAASRAALAFWQSREDIGASGFATPSSSPTNRTSCVKLTPSTPSACASPSSPPSSAGAAALARARSVSNLTSPEGAKTPPSRGAASLRGCIHAHTAHAAASDARLRRWSSSEASAAPPSQHEEPAVPSARGGGGAQSAGVEWVERQLARSETLADLTREYQAAAQLAQVLPALTAATSEASAEQPSRHEEPAVPSARGGGGGAQSAGVAWVERQLARSETLADLTREYQAARERSNSGRQQQDEEEEDQRDLSL